MPNTTWTPDEMAALNAVLAEKDATIDGLRAQLATAQKWRTRWKAMAHRKRQHHRNALAALGLNITYVRELQQEVKRLDEQVDGLQAQLAAPQAATPVADAEGVVWEPVRFDKTISDYEEVMAYYALQINRFNDLHEKPPMAICQRRPHAQQDGQGGVGDE